MGVGKMFIFSRYTHATHTEQALVTELSPKDERRTLALGRLSISYGLGMTVTCASLILYLSFSPLL
jgi:hypothetical protein